MSKFCSNCGAQLEDNSNFCTSCGAKSEPIETPQPIVEPKADTIEEPVSEPITEPTSEQPEATEENAVPDTEQVAESTVEPANASPFVAYTPNDTAALEPAPSNAAYSENTVEPEPPKKSGKGVLIAILIIILALLIGAGILIYFLFFSSAGCEETVEAFYEAQEDFEFEDFKEAIGYTTLVTIVEDKNSSDIETFKTGCRRMKTVYETSNIDVDYDCEILSMNKIDKDKLDNYDKDSLVAQKGYEVDVSYTVKDDNTNESSTGSETLTVIKYDGDWCVTDALDAIDSIISIGKLSDDDFTAALEYYE